MALEAKTHFTSSLRSVYFGVLTCRHLNLKTAHYTGRLINVEVKYTSDNKIASLFFYLIAVKMNVPCLVSGDQFHVGVPPARPSSLLYVQRTSALQTRSMKEQQPHARAHEAHTAHCHSKTAVMKHRTLRCVPIVWVLNTCKNDNKPISPSKTIAWNCEGKCPVIFYERRWTNFKIVLQSKTLNNLCVRSMSIVFFCVSIWTS